MRINKIFYSIQGEGILQGLPTIFIRLAGCNLRCKYCDTTYAYNKGQEKSISKIIKIIKMFKCKRVCITGGEPLLQKETIKLVKKLRDYDISIETNGSLDISEYMNKTIISLDIKCPCSGCEDKMYFKNLNKIGKKDQVKFIIKTKKDFEYALKIIKKYHLNKRTNIIISPVFGSNYKKIVSLILKSGLDLRFGIQLHKFIWGVKKGV
jgi:7-carboxy-7-deazaguanine synthase